MTRGKNLFLPLPRQGSWLTILIFSPCYNILERTWTAVAGSVLRPPTSSRPPSRACPPPPPLLSPVRTWTVHGSVPRCSLLKKPSFVSESGLSSSPAPPPPPPPPPPPRQPPLTCRQTVITERQCVPTVFLYPLRSLLEVVSRQNGRTDIWTHFCCVFPLQ